ncbi:MAG: carboxypeptidase regulatory-like domain-containing protein [Gemmatimonadales bacterium]
MNQLLFLIQAVAATPAAATVRGTVRDGESGEPLRGATVALITIARATSSDLLGAYRLDSVPTGRQRITVWRLGYRTWSFDLIVPADGLLEVNITLAPAPQHLPPVVVRDVPDRTGVPWNLNPDRLGRRVLSSEMSRGHPLVAEPDPVWALWGQGVGLDPEAPTGTHLDGGSADQTGYLLDGVPILNPFHAAGGFSAWNPDALDRIAVTQAFAEPGAPAFLSGTVQAVTRSPGERFRAAGYLSTNQIRFAADGPIGRGFGFLVSGRAGNPGLLAPKEQSYLRGEGTDLLVKAQGPVLGGQLRALIWSNANDLDAAAAPATESATSPVPRHELEWLGRSVGFNWMRAGPAGTMRVTGWSSQGATDGRWWAGTGALDLTSRRRDEGLSLLAQRGAPGRALTVGVSVERLATAYRLAGNERLADEPGAESRQGIVTALMIREFGLDRRLTLTLGTRLIETAGPFRVAPEAELRWHPGNGVVAGLTVARRFQFAQSLRNPESFGSELIPADLYLGAGDHRVPVGRSDQATFTLALRSGSGLHGDLRAFHKRLGGVVFVAAEEPGLFAGGPVATGTGSAIGASAALGWNSSAFDVQVGYDWLQVRTRRGGADFVPGHGLAHVAQGGLTVRTPQRWTVRLGAAAIFGRRGTGQRGGLEWEGCNLADRGCEFAGSPLLGESVGSRALPGYLRFDLSARKEWRLRVSGGQTTLGAFGTLTNLFGRANIRGYLMDPGGTLTGLEMRPRAPLVIGIDWRP